MFLFSSSFNKVCAGDHDCVCFFCRLRPFNEHVTALRYIMSFSSSLRVRCGFMPWITFHMHYGVPLPHVAFSYDLLFFLYIYNIKSQNVRVCPQKNVC